MVSYPELVEAPEAWTRRILDHCGLKEEAQVHASHETERIVRTASALQVRRPINRDGVGQWLPFEPWLEPLRAALGDLPETYATRPQS